MKDHEMAFMAITATLVGNIMGTLILHIKSRHRSHLIAQLPESADDGRRYRPGHRRDSGDLQSILASNIDARRIKSVHWGKRTVSYI
ncbi:hypothetical protein Dda_0317 [Drechslerella dactyloides]|uniref:Uncharacterized protein n=1 Tax=Drechslerella dactyloides TaxID=74499 RepID=A0AAD6NND0_DREDA|nr:hypothetical protein Dda_0317 [Drechslerella dactyloides]